MPCWTWQGRSSATGGDTAIFATAKPLATLFYEPSTRTRLLFEAAMLNLEAVLGFLGLPTAALPLRAKSIADTIRVVSCYADICHPPPKRKAPLGIPIFPGIPVINAGTEGISTRPKPLPTC